MQKLNPTLILTIKMIYLSFFTGLSLYMALGSFHWYMAWMALEFNTVAIIPFITSTKNPATNNAIKYCIMQALPSATLAFFLMTNFWKTGTYHSSTTNLMFVTLITIALGTKLGVIPFHYWTLNIIKEAPLKMGFILTTAHKMILFYTLIELVAGLNIGIAIMSTLIFKFIWTWYTLYETELWKMVTYSPMLLMVWTFISVLFYSITPLYMAIYMSTCVILFIILYILSRMDLSKIPVFWAYLPPLLIHTILYYLVAMNDIDLLVMQIGCSMFSLKPPSKP